MSIPVLRRSALAATCASVLLFSGCVVAPYGPAGGYGDVVYAAPPPPQQEVIGVAPIAGQIWIGGYWGWVGGRHHWTPGHWSAPRPGHVWVPHAWVRSGNGWRLNDGHWQRR